MKQLKLMICGEPSIPSQYIVERPSLSTVEREHRSVGGSGPQFYEWTILLEPVIKVAAELLLEWLKGHIFKIDGKTFCPNGISQQDKDELVYKLEHLEP